MAKNSANRAARAARLRAISSSPAAVTATLTTRASPGSLRRSASPWPSSRETSWVMAGCDTFSWAASSVSLHGPSRDNLARVNAAVELSSPGTASRRHMDTSCSSAPASSSHSAPAAAPGPVPVPVPVPVAVAVPVTGVVIIQKLYHVLIYAAYTSSCRPRPRPRFRKKYRGNDHLRPKLRRQAGKWRPGLSGGAEDQTSPTREAGPTRGSGHCRGEHPLHGRRGDDRGTDRLVPARLVGPRRRPRP